jgi:hypothetical protein
MDYIQSLTNMNYLIPLALPLIRDNKSTTNNSKYSDAYSI